VASGQVSRIPIMSRAIRSLTSGFRTNSSCPDWKPFTVRFDVVNLFDHVYELRDGTGIGVFAPQWGPRRGFFIGLSQKF
jgi:outer membrane receptor protein involved in Fe transport